MLKITVSRDDTLSQAMPDIALSGDVTLVCAFRESSLYTQRDLPPPLPDGLHSRISVRRSHDEGNTWGPVAPVGGVRKEYGYLNCPRLCRLQDGTILLAVDWLPPGDSPEAEKAKTSCVWLWRSSDKGETWDGPQKTSIYGLVPSLKQLQDGTLLCGVSAWNEVNEENMLVHRSNDLGHTWEGPILVAESPGYNFSEGDFVELDEGQIVCYLRENGLVGLKTLSADGGRTWHGPYRTGLLSCQGRPSAGLLRSGEVFVTYRCDWGGMFCMYVESQAQAADRAALDKRVYGRAFMIDIDRARPSHYGYSGWAQLSGGDIYVVQHLIDDAAPGARHVRGYRIARHDWALYPAPPRC